MTMVNKCKKITLKTLRKKLKMSQETFASKFGVSRESVSHWERGRQKPALSLDQIKVLNELLKSAGMDISEISDESVA